MLADRPGHRATTANFMSAFPFQAQAGLGNRGAYIGQNRLGSAFCFDPWVLYGDRILTNPNVLIFGEVGSAKSSLVKCFLNRQLIMRDRRCVIIDPKGEYGPLARAWGVEPIKLTPGGEVRLNPLNPRADKKEQLSLLLAVTAAAKGEALTPQEKAAATSALNDASSRAAEPTIPMIYHALLSPSAAMAEELKMDTAQLADEVRGAAHALKNLCDGPLAGMFDGQTSGNIDLDARVVVLDLTAFSSSESVGILMACASAWLKAEIRAQREAGSSVKNFWVVDEGWKILAHPGVGEWLQDSYKHSRAYGISNIMVLHRLSDLTSAGDAGSRIERLAQGLLDDTGTHVIYRQAPGAMDQLRNTYHLTEVELEVVKSNSRGSGLWIIGEHKFVVHHDVSPDEWQMIDTDQRMTETSPELLL